MDANGVFDRAYDKANTQLSTTQVNAATAAATSKHDANWIWDAVFDKATNTIRVVHI
jgi:hypothetical protein